MSEIEKQWNKIVDNHNISMKEIFNFVLSMRNKNESLKTQLAEKEKEIEKLSGLLSTVNDHAESCSIFIYNDKGCNCFYGKINQLESKK